MLHIRLIIVACCVWSCFALTHLKLNKGFLGLDSHSCGIFLTKCTCQNHLKKSQQVGCSSISWAGRCNLTTKWNWVGEERSYTPTIEATERRIFSIWQEQRSESTLLGCSQRRGRTLPSDGVLCPRAGVAFLVFAPKDASAFTRGITPAPPPRLCNAGTPFLSGKLAELDYGPIKEEGGDSGAIPIQVWLSTVITPLSYGAGTTFLSW